jgi:hypothetical protein
MITWHEVIEKSDIKGEYFPPTFKLEDVSIEGRNGVQFLTSEASGIGYFKGGGWFAEDVTASAEWIFPEDGFQVCEGVGNYIFANRLISSYANGGGTISYFGILYAFEEGGEITELGGAECEESFFDSDWSRSTTTLNSYIFTDFTNDGRTTEQVNTSTSILIATGFSTTITTTNTTEIKTFFSDSAIVVPTWEALTYSTVLFRGQTFRRNYSKFGNVAPVKTTILFDNVTSLSFVETTHDNLSFVEQKTIEKDREDQITNSITRIANFFDETFDEVVSTALITGFILGGVPFPELQPTPFPFWAGSQESTYLPTITTGEQQLGTEVYRTTSSSWEVFNSKIRLGQGSVVKTYEDSFTVETLSSINGYIPSFTFTAENFFNAQEGGTVSINQSEETPISSVFPKVETLNRVGTGTPRIHYSHKVACQLTDGEIGGGSRYVTPAGGQSFYPFTIDAAIPAAGSTITSNSTYSFYGPNFTVFVRNEEGKINTALGSIDVAGETTSYYKEELNIIPNNIIFGGNLAGNGVLPAGLYTTYEEIRTFIGGDFSLSGNEGTRLVTSPTSFSWNSDEIFTIYKKIEHFKILDEEPNTETLAGFDMWEIPLTIVDD